jgi:hypothetical protein
MTTSVRMSDLHNSDNDLMSSKAGVNTLRARFERIGQSDENIAASSAGQNYRYSSSSVPRKPSTPQARRTQGPARPPPPRPSEKPMRFSDQFPEQSEPFNTRSVTPTAGAPGALSPQSLSPHPLSTSSRSRSVGDLKVVKQETPANEVNGSAAVVTVEEVDGPVAKKGKKGKNKGKGKEDNSNGTSSGSSSGKKFLHFKKGKSTESPRASPDPSKHRKSSAPIISSQSSPHSSPDPLPPTLESPSSTSSEAGSSKEGTPTSGRRKSSSGGKKEALKKTESSQGDLASGRENGKVDKKALRKSKSNLGGTSVSAEKQEGDMLGASPRNSPAVGGRKRRGREVGEADAKTEARRIREAAILGAGWYNTSSQTPRS